MERSLRLLSVALVGAAFLALLACGGGGGDLGAVQGAASPEFQPVAPPAAWTDDGCALCHGADGSGGGGPDLRCSSFERLDAVRDAATSHAGGAFPQLTDATLLDMVAFLRTADCAGGAPTDPTPTPGGGVPPSHTENEDGVLHHPDYERNLATCTTCHGPRLEGTAFAPSCASCHGSGGGFDDDDDDLFDDHGGDDDDHDDDDDDDDDHDDDDHDDDD